MLRMCPIRGAVPGRSRPDYFSISRISCAGQLKRRIKRCFGAADIFIGRRKLRGSSDRSPHFTVAGSILKPWTTPATCAWSIPKLVKLRHACVIFVGEGVGVGEGEPVYPPRKSSPLLGNRGFQKGVFPARPFCNIPFFICQTAVFPPRANDSISVVGKRHTAYAPTFRKSPESPLAYFSKTTWHPPVNPRCYAEKQTASP